MSFHQIKVAIMFSSYLSDTAIQIMLDIHHQFPQILTWIEDYHNQVDTEELFDELGDKIAELVEPLGYDTALLIEDAGYAYVELASQIVWAK